MIAFKTLKHRFAFRTLRNFSSESISASLGLKGRKSLVDYTRIVKSDKPNYPYLNYTNKYASAKTKELFERENSSVGHTFFTLPVTVTRGDGPYVFDEQGNKYFDCIMGISSVNQGHRNKEIIEAATAQMDKLYFTSRCVYTEPLADAAEYICEQFNYEKVLFMNTGVEAAENACKYARRWGYTHKNIPDGQATILMFNGCFWGRTISACSGSSDPLRKHQIGPLTPGFDLVDWNDLEAVAKYLESTPNCAAVMAEPIQGEGGINMPKEGFLKGLRELCDKHGVLLIIDEIQAGLGRAGSLLAQDCFGVKGDLVCMGKSISGGLMPISGLLGSRAVLDVVQPGWNGSTFAGSTMSAAVCKAAVKYVIDNKLPENSVVRGMELTQYLKSIVGNNKFVKEIRAKGLMVGIEFHPNDYFSSWECSLALMEAGVISRTTKDIFIRVFPALTISSEEAFALGKIIGSVLNSAEEEFGSKMPANETVYNIESPNEEAQNNIKQWEDELNALKK